MHLSSPQGQFLPPGADAGFQSIGPFNRAFKAATDLTSTEYRRLALAKEQTVAVSFSSTVRRCARCRSGAINPSDHGRTEGVDLDLCDVCYWRKRAESANWPKPQPSAECAGIRSDSDRYAELTQLGEDCQREAMDSTSPVVVFDNALRLVLDWRHR